MSAVDAWIVRKVGRISGRSIVLLVGVFARTGGIFSVTPQGFLPEEDQGAMFAVLQIPEGASLNRTSDVTREIEEILLADPAVEHVIAVIGLNFRSEEHTSELQSLMRISYAVFCLKTKKDYTN